MISGYAWYVETRLCRLKRSKVCSLNTPPHYPRTSDGGRLLLGGGKEGDGENPLKARTLLILMSPMSLLARGVKKEDKTLAVGIQFMLLRVLGKEPVWDHWSRCPLCVRPGGRDTRMNETQSLTLRFIGPWGNRSNPGTWRWVCKQLGSPSGKQLLKPGSGVGWRDKNLWAERPPVAQSP